MTERDQALWDMKVYIRSRLELYERHEDKASDRRHFRMLRDELRAILAWIGTTRRAGA